MRNLNHLVEYRQEHLGEMGDETCGKFLIPDPEGKFFYFVIASDYSGWNHVSVSLKTLTNDQLHRCPRWNEMCYIKDLFFEKDECVIQYHPAKRYYINRHSYVLHMWKPEGDFPTPPLWMV